MTFLIGYLESSVLKALSLGAECQRSLGLGFMAPFGISTTFSRCPRPKEIPLIRIMGSKQLKKHLGLNNLVTT